MVDDSKRVFLPIPQSYYDLSEAEQEAICLQMADTLIAALGVPDRLDCTVQSENPGHQPS